MRSRLTRISLRRSGGTAHREETHTGDAIRIGRSESNEITLEGLSVSLHHAELVARSDGIYLVPQPPAMVLRDGRSIDGDIRLEEGDTLRVGTHELRVTGIGRNDLDIELALQPPEPRSSDLEALKSRSRLGIEQGVWTRSRIGFVATWVVLGLCLLFPLASGWQASWSTGPISNNHASIAEDCSACHQPFGRVSNDSCLTCHATISSHVDAHPELADVDALRCASCHLEHDGAEGLAALGDRTCATCHADAKGDTRNLEPASDFSAVHPEFTLHLLEPGTNATEEEPSTTRRVLWSLDAEERSGLKFNHWAHVSGERMLDAERSSLPCDSCHRVDAGGRRMQPVSFEIHCRSCHALNFAHGSRRLRETQAVHGQPGELQRQLRLVFLGEALPQEPGETERERRSRTLRFTRPGSPRTPEEEELLQHVSRQTEDAFELLMSEEYCGLCHTLLPDSEQATDVAPVSLTRAWFGTTQFDHSSHASTPCASCHPRAAARLDDDEWNSASESRTSPNEGPYALLPLAQLESQGLEASERASDVLVPGRATCRECHGGSRARAPEVASECVMCHAYHDRENTAISERLIRN